MIALPLIALCKVPMVCFRYSSVGSAERNTGIPHFDSKFQFDEYIRAIALPLQ